MSVDEVRPNLGEVLAMIKEKYREHNEIGLESLEESQVANYKCSQCGCSGRKLWREMNVINRIEVRCVECIPDVKPEVLERVKEGASECGWWVAAIPCGGGGYWGYSHVPEKLVKWWHSMSL